MNSLNISEGLESNLQTTKGNGILCNYFNAILITRKRFGNECCTGPILSLCSLSSYLDSVDFHGENFLCRFKKSNFSLNRTEKYCSNISSNVIALK